MLVLTQEEYNAKKILAKRTHLEKEEKYCNENCDKFINRIRNAVLNREYLLDGDYMTVPLECVTKRVKEETGANFGISFYELLCYKIQRPKYVRLGKYYSISHEDFNS